MNILPKKSWHVRRPENKERVRRDEENARLEAKKEQERIGLAEKEARIAYLRKKSGIVEVGEEEVSGESKEVVKIGGSGGGHLNLFAAEESAGSSGFTKDNAEYVKEKQAEQEKLEKSIGLLTYVGQSQLEAKESEQKLWYLEKRKHTENNKTKDGGSSDDSEVDECKKSRLDPLAVVEKHLKGGDKHSKRGDHKKKKKKRKKDKKGKEEEEEGRSKSASSSSKKSLELLREERLRREEKERRRSEVLLMGGDPSSGAGAGVSSREAAIGNDNNKYFSQFNPEIARRKGKR